MSAPADAIKACIKALVSIPANQMALAASATTDYSQFAATSDPFGFSADVGNFDLCERQEGLTHCLAGSTPLNVENVYLPAFAGLCVPMECSIDQILTEPKIFEYLNTQVVELLSKDHTVDVSSSVMLTLEGQQSYNYMTKLVNIISVTQQQQQGYTCGGHTEYMTIDRWIFCAVVTVLGLVVLASTIYHMVMMDTGGGRIPSLLQKMVDAFSLIKNVPYVFQDINSGGGKPMNPTNITASVSTIDLAMETQSPRAATPDSLPREVPDNNTSTSTAVNVPTKKPERFQFLDGFRTLSMMWIIVGHTLTTAVMNGIVNPATLLPPTGMLRDMSAQVFMSARFAVDTFFYISGFLVAVSLLRRLYVTQSVTEGDDDDTKESTAVRGYSAIPQAVGTGSVQTATVTPLAKKPPPLIRWLPMFYLHRLLRILPPYAFCLLLWWKIGVMLGNGPFWIKWNQYAYRCDTYFWTNLFFINNIYPYDLGEGDQCFYVSWYLACDMQFYLISPIFILAFLRNRWFGVSLISTVCLASCVYAYWWSIQTGASGQSFDGANVLIYSHGFYAKPQFRFPPYGLGMLSGMVQAWQKKEYPDFKYPYPNALLAAAVAILFYIMYIQSYTAYQNRPCSLTEYTSTQCGSDWSTEQLAWYNSSSKPLWCLALSIITLLSANKQGGFIQAFLGHSVWGPPAKLSFAVYLLHVTILNLTVLSTTQKWRYSHFEFLAQVTSVICLSFVLGLFVAVFIESPACRISKQIETSILEYYASNKGKTNGAEAGIEMKPSAAVEIKHMEGDVHSIGKREGSAFTRNNGSGGNPERTSLLHSSNA